MQSRIIIGICGLLAAAVPLHAHATHYRWVDGQGQLHFSDTLTSEAMHYGYDRVNDRGLVVSHVQRELSPQERAAAKQQADDQAAIKQAEDERSRNDQQLLLAYPEEAIYRQSQQAKLDTLDQQIETTRANLHMQEKTLADMLARAGDLQRAKQPVPKFMDNSIAQQHAVVTQQRATLDKQQAARSDTARQQAADLAHYRALKADQAQPPQ